MVSRESLKKFRENFEQYNREVNYRNFVKKSLNLAKDTLEYDVSLYTLPSVVVPVPEYIVKKFRNKLRRK